MKIILNKGEDTMFGKKRIAVVLMTALIISQFSIVSAAQEKMAKAYFGTFTGVIQEINLHGADQSMQLVLVKNAEEAIANLVVTEGTYMIGGQELEVGQEVTGYYVADAPMIMIYPPQYPAKVIRIENDEQQIKIDRFNEELISDDHLLKLNDVSETVIVDENEEPFMKKLSGRQLIVYYDMATKSIPAQTNPTRIVVLDREQEIMEMDIVVQGAVIEGPQAFENPDGTIMVPIRAIAEALGYEVQWENATRKVLVGNVSSFQIDVNAYAFAKMMPMELAAAPVIVNDRSYIPLEYFTKVLNLSEAYVGEYEIIIHDAALFNE